LRACRVRELEEKRINKEMAHIRQKFRGAAGSVSSCSMHRDLLTDYCSQTATWTADRRKSEPRDGA
jgi:hypothetical protein